MQARACKFVGTVAVGERMRHWYNIEGLGLALKCRQRLNGEGNEDFM